MEQKTIQGKKTRCKKKRGGRFKSKKGGKDHFLLLLSNIEYQLNRGGERVAEKAARGVVSAEESRDDETPHRRETKRLQDPEQYTGRCVYVLGGVEVAAKKGRRKEKSAVEHRIDYLMGKGGYDL